MPSINYKSIQEYKACKFTSPPALATLSQVLSGVDMQLHRNADGVISLKVKQKNSGYLNVPVGSWIVGPPMGQSKSMMTESSKTYLNRYRD
jgi:hypothetical protein